MNTQHTPEPKDYKPAATYDLLLLQFNALKKILAGCEHRCAEYHDGWRKAMSDEAKANKAENSALRETNERLTNDLLLVEQQLDELLDAADLAVNVRHKSSPEAVAAIKQLQVIIIKHRGQP